MFLNELYHSLNPVAFSLGPLSVRWYGIAYLAGFALAAWVIWRVSRRWELDLTPDDVMSIVIGVAFGVIIGARLFYVVFYGVGYYLEHPLEIFALNQGGMSFHGGFAGAVVAGSIACRMYHISIPTVCDLGVIGAPWGLFFGRCANFVNGELWGKETSLPWGVMFPTGGNVYRHPSQLYEALLEGLNSGKIRGAGLDVYAEEPAKNEALLNHPNVSCTPHIGAATKEAQKRIGMEIVSIIDNL